MSPTRLVYQTGSLNRATRWASVALGRIHVVDLLVEDQDVYIDTICGTHLGALLGWYLYDFSHEVFAFHN